jgi:hypothetical protein
MTQTVNPQRAVSRRYCHAHVPTPAFSDPTAGVLRGNNRQGDQEKACVLARGPLPQVGPRQKQELHRLTRPTDLVEPVSYRSCEI